MNRRLWKTVTAASILLMLGSLVSCNLPESPGRPHSQDTLALRILHINDTHSHFDATTAQVRPQPDADTVYTYIGGHPRLLTEAQRQRQLAQQQGLPALFLHGGDAFKGTAWFELFQEHINIDVLNRMGLHAMALGNHEFDAGMPALANFINSVNFPVVAANVDTVADKHLADVDNLRPYVLFEIVPDRDGHTLQAVPATTHPAAAHTTVAVFGLALQDMQQMVSDTGNLTFSAEVDSAQRTVDHLQAQGITRIIALTHLGHERDRRLATQVNGIDVIVGGHSHSLLGDFSHWLQGQQPEYAARFSNPDGHGSTCVVQAGQFAQAMGALTVEFDSEGAVTRCEGENTLLASRDFFTAAQRTDDSRINGQPLADLIQHVDALPRTRITDEHTGLRAHLDQHYRPAVDNAYGAQITAIDTALPHVRLPGSGNSNVHGSRLAGRIADGLHWWLNAHTQQQQLQRPVDFMLIGAGNIRASLEAGPVYEGHWPLEVLPFDTPLSVLRISGLQLRTLLTDVISATLPPGAHTGKFPYTSQLRYIVQERPGNQADLTQLQWFHQGHWVDIADQQLYTMATTSYLADGNDGWQLLAELSLDNSQRIDVILREQQPELHRTVSLSPGRVRYDSGETLPCADASVDCKVAARAMIEYLQAVPGALQTPRTETTTLYRYGD